MFINEYLKRFTRPSGRIKGDWDYRLRGLFTSNVNFNDKTVLDVGCHMGIICYEIAKLKPKAIHGIEGNKKACMVAQSIFEYVSIPSRFKRLDLKHTPALNTEIDGQYDIVLYLGVDQHIRKGSNHAKANAVLARICEVCTGTILIRASQSSIPHIRELCARNGFSEVGISPESGATPIYRFDSDADTKNRASFFSMDGLIQIVVLARPSFEVAAEMM